jgi:acetyl-CoA carboxylase biotin carboxyl carrier protein
MEKKEVKTAPKTPELKAAGNHFDIAEISELLKAFNKSNVNELKLEKGDFKITIKQGGAIVTQVVSTAPQGHTIASSAAVPAPQAAPAAAPAAAAPSNTITIKSPMIGTFYRSAGPGKPAFINVGDNIEKGQVTCIVEAMKLFNEIESEVSGKIVKILIDDASPVEYDQPLFLVEPA